MFSCIKNAQVNFEEKPQLKVNSFQNYKHGYIIHTWLDNDFKGTVSK